METESRDASSTAEARTRRRRFGRALVILNPTAGRHDPEETRRDLQKALDHHGLAHEIRATRREGDAADWAGRAAAEKFDLVIAAGGDGSIMEVVSGVVRSGRPVPIGHVPLGTANVIAASLGIPSGVEEAIEAIWQGPVMSFDVGRLPERDRFFLLAAAIGYPASIIRDAPRQMKDRLGFVAYVFAAIRNLFRLRRVRITIENDGVHQTFRGHTVLALNLAERANLRLRLGSEVDPHDGELLLAVVRTRSIGKILAALFWSLVRRERAAHGVDSLQVRDVRISANRDLVVQVDGELVGHSPVRIQVVPAAIEMVVPESYRGDRGSAS